MAAVRSVASCLLCSVVLLPALLPSLASGQERNAQALVQSIVRGELAADARDHSLWMYRDAKTLRGKSTVTLVVQTRQGNLSRTIAIDGHPLTAQQQKDDEQKMEQFVTDPSLRQKQKQNEQQDARQATALTRMLPDAFLWTITGQNGPETTLVFRSNPSFRPPTRQARVFAAMEGTMVVNTTQKRIQSIKGKLTRNVNFGFGLLGKLNRGGTFDVERTQVGPNLWVITATRVHIQGHALLFKSISEQQDEETSDYKRAPQNVTLQAAEEMLNDGRVAKTLGVPPQ